VARTWVEPSAWGRCLGWFSDLTSLGGGDFTSVGPCKYHFLVCPGFGIGDDPAAQACCDNVPPGPDWYPVNRLCTFPLSDYCLWAEGGDPNTGSFSAASVRVLDATDPAYPHLKWARPGKWNGSGWTFLDPVTCMICDSAGEASFGLARCFSICPICPSGYTFDEASGKCWTGDGDVFPCPPGTIYDGECEECVSTDPPQSCWTWVDCEWQPPDTDCEGESYWDWTDCRCECPPGECLHEPTGECVDEDEGIPCDPNCWWSPTYCDCKCCDEGYCWCETSGTCVPCSIDEREPKCLEGRECVWDPEACDWACVTPECPEGEEYDLETCSCQPEGAEIDGCDIAETANGWLHVAFRSGADVHVARSTDAGATWESQIVATDAATGSTGAAPTLLVIPDGGDTDTLLLLYHNANPSLKAWRSGNLGDTWSRFATHVGYRYPRGAWLPDGRLPVVLMNGSQLELFQSTDWLLTDPELASTLVTGPPQLACLRVDRFRRAHLVYMETDGDLQHRSSAALEAGEWTADAEVSIVSAPEDFPAYAVGDTGGFLMAFEDTQIISELLTETYDAQIGVREVPDVALTPMYPGLIYNRYQDLLFACKKDPPTDDLIFVYLSPDEGESWQVLNSGAGI